MATQTNGWGVNKAEATSLVVFIPSANRHGKALGKSVQDRWVRRALELLGTHLGGATAFPRGFGVWRDDEQEGKLVWDRPVLIQCFTNDTALKRSREALQTFLVRLGRQTAQGAVGFVIDRVYYEIQFPLENE